MVQIDLWRRTLRVRFNVQGSKLGMTPVRFIKDRNTLNFEPVGRLAVFDLFQKFVGFLFVSAVVREFCRQLGDGIELRPRRGPLMPKMCVRANSPGLR